MYPAEVPSSLPRVADAAYPTIDVFDILIHFPEPPLFLLFLLVLKFMCPGRSWTPWSPWSPWDLSFAALTPSPIPYRINKSYSSACKHFEFRNRHSCNKSRYFKSNGRSDVPCPMSLSPLSPLLRKHELGHAKLSCICILLIGWKAQTPCQVHLSN